MKPPIKPSLKQTITVSSNTEEITSAKMMLQLARRGRLSSIAPKLRDFFPAPAPAFAAAICSKAAPTAKASENSSNESIHAQVSCIPIKELKAQLATRNLNTHGKKHNLIERLARSLSTSSSQRRVVGENRSIEEVPEMPDIRGLANEDEAPIRVPLTPDNKFARYHRHEIVPGVAPPLKPEVTTVLPDASTVIDQAADTLTKVLESISVEVKAHKSQSQYSRERNDAKGSVKGIIEDLTTSMIPREGSALHMVGRFPVDLMKDMIEDVFSSGKRFVREEKQDREEGNEENKGPQVLTDTERTALYTIGGLSAVWYLFGY